MHVIMKHVLVIIITLIGASESMPTNGLDEVMRIELNISLCEYYDMDISCIRIKYHSRYCAECSPGTLICTYLEECGIPIHCKNTADILHRDFDCTKERNVNELLALLYGYVVGITLMCTSCYLYDVWKKIKSLLSYYFFCFNTHT